MPLSPRKGVQFYSGSLSSPESPCCCNWLLPPRATAPPCDSTAASIVTSCTTAAGSAVTSDPTDLASFRPHVHNRSTTTQSPRPYSSHAFTQNPAAPIPSTFPLVLLPGVANRHRKARLPARSRCRYRCTHSFANTSKRPSYVSFSRNYLPLHKTRGCSLKLPSSHLARRQSMSLLSGCTPLVPFLSPASVQLVPMSD